MQKSNRAKYAGWALAVRGYRATTKCVLATLAERGDDTGRCWPGVETLAWTTNASARMVQYALRTLEADGLLTIEYRGARGGRNVYRVNLEELERRAMVGEAERQAKMAEHKRRQAQAKREKRAAQAAELPAPIVSAAEIARRKEVAARSAQVFQSISTGQGPNVEAAAKAFESAPAQSAGCGRVCEFPVVRKGAVVKPVSPRTPREKQATATAGTRPVIFPQSERPRSRAPAGGAA